MSPGAQRKALQWVTYHTPFNSKMLIQNYLGLKLINIIYILSPLPINWNICLRVFGFFFLIVSCYVRLIYDLVVGIIPKSHSIKLSFHISTEFYEYIHIYCSFKKFHILYLPLNFSKL